MPTGTLIGRDRELDELENRARGHRLVTVVGPGGVGKTALARAVAGRVGDSFPLGVRHVDLTRIDDDVAVPGALAAQLGFDSFDALLSSPADRPVLLVVDNCEHLLDATAASLVQVLGACQQPTVLATSRSPLELPGESVMSLAPLAFSVPGDDPVACPAVQLFLQRCRDAGARVDDGDAPAVVDLCRQLDGLPLLIEIAAARARTMSIAEIAARLNDSVDVLHRPRFRGGRHRGVAETIRWSFNLLEPSAADLFEQLAVFSGPFSAATAESVARPNEADRFEADLDDLVNASLITVDTSGPETRYQLLSTVRRFGLDRLAERDALESAYDRFVDHVIASARRTLSGATLSWRAGLMRELMDGYDDMGEALRWCNSTDTSPARAHTLCSILWAIVHQGHADDIAELLRRTLDRWPDRQSPAAAQTVAALATAEYVTGQPAKAVALAAPTLAGLAGPTLASVTLARVLGQGRRALGDDLTGAVDAFRAGAAIGHELGVTAMATELEIAAALVVADLGDVEQAIAQLTVIVDDVAATDSAITESWARSALAWVLLRVDPSAALTMIEAALTQARRLDYPIAVAVNLRSRAFAQFLLDDAAAATGSAVELLDDLLQRGALSNVRLLVDITAVLAHHRGHPLWETVVATARTLPITTLVASQYELVPLPQTTRAPLPRHDVIAAVRNVLTDLAVADPETSDPAVNTPGESASNATIRCRSDICEISYASQAVTVRSSKGVHNLVRLIEAAGREIHCLDLAEAGVEQASTGEVIDADARRQYEQRIRDLQDEIEEAEDDNDYARSYRHQVELDSLIDHLTAARGHGGRTRRAADNAERARSAVTHRLRATIRQLDKLHPALARHLTHSIKTGAYCSYRPEHATTWMFE